MSSVPLSEAVAGLKLLVAVAKADGELTPAEHAVLADALASADLGEAVTLESLVADAGDPAALAAQISSPEIRDATFSSCFAMAYADRECLPEETAVLAVLESSWNVPKAKLGLLDKIVSETRDVVSLSRIQPIVDPVRRKAEIDGDVVKYSVLSAVLGLNPLPIVSIATDLAVVGLQAKMFRDVGQYWGRETSDDAVKQILAGVGVGTGARIAVNGFMKFVPGLGSVFAAATNFASTWALGQVANQYWESGGKADERMLRELFTKSKAEGRKAYERMKDTVTAKQSSSKDELDRLAAQLQAGELSQSEYESRVAALK